MGRFALIAVLLAMPHAAASGMQAYAPSNSVVTYSATSSTYGTATASIQETSGQSTTGGWSFCAHHAVSGSSCAGAGHLPAGTVSKWIASGQTTLITLPNGAQCYQHADPSGANWCYAGEPVQDSIGTTGGPFGTTPDTTVNEIPNQGEAWWGSGGGPNDAVACEGMFGNAPSNQASPPSCEQQFGTVTWDTSGGTVASINAAVDEMAWRIGSWNGAATPGGVSCGSRTAIGSISADSQPPNGLWMQWGPSPARGFWNCTAEDQSAGPPQSGWNGSSWYSRAFADWNGFGWYLVYYDYATFLETPGTTVNGVATSISCDGFSSGTTVTSSVPTAVDVTIDEGSGLATFTDQGGTVLSEVSCTNSPTPRPTVPSPPPSPPTTSPGAPPPRPSLYASAYALFVPVGDTGAINVLTQNAYTGTPRLTLVQNSPQPGALDTDPSSVDFGYFTWSPTSVDVEKAYYQMCDSTGGCAQSYVELHSTQTTSTTTCAYYCGAPPPTTAVPPTTHPPSPNVTLRVEPNAYPVPDSTVTLIADATNPTSPTFGLRIEQLDGTLLRDCGQTTTCHGDDYSQAPVVRRYVGVLSYPDGSPSQYSNEVTVTWSAPAVALTVCPTAAACPDVSATPAPDATVYLRATAYGIGPVDELHQVYWRLVIVDDETRQAVDQCPIGENPCQMPVSQPAGTAKTYFAVFTYENQIEPTAYSNPVTVRWGVPPPTTSPPTTPPPTTPPPTTAPPTTTPATTTTTSPSGGGRVRPT